MTSVFVSARADFHVTSSHRFQFVVSRKWRVSDTKKQPWFFLVVCNKNQAAEGCFWVLLLHLLSNSPEASCCDWTCVSWQYKMTQQTYISSNIHTWTTLFNWPFLFEHMWLCMHSQCCSTVETFLLCHVELLIRIKLQFSIFYCPCEIVRLSLTVYWSTLPSRGKADLSHKNLTIH